MFSYKPLLRLLVEIDMTKTQLREATGMSMNTLAKISNFYLNFVQKENMGFIIYEICYSALMNQILKQEKNMFTVEIDHMNLHQIANSGQCFRWQQINDNTYKIPAFGRELTISQDGNTFILSCDEEEWNGLWKNYFDLKVTAHS